MASFDAICPWKILEGSKRCTHPHAGWRSTAAHSHSNVCRETGACPRALLCQPTLLALSTRKPLERVKLLKTKEPTNQGGEEDVGWEGEREML